MNLKLQSYLFILVGWLIFIGIGYLMFSNIWGAILFLPAIVICMLVFMSIFVAVTEIMPSYFMRWLRGPPWKYPRTLSQRGSRRDRIDLIALEARLDEVDKCNKKWATLYVDRHTAQHWIKQDTDKFSYYIPISGITDWKSNHV